MRESGTATSMDEITDAVAADHAGDDPVATSRAVERAARRVLASEPLDDQDALDLKTACEQLAADRTNGENLDSSIRRLRVLLARSRAT